MGIPEELLLQQAGAAQLRDHLHYEKLQSQIKSILEKDKGYGDQLDDQDFIRKGFDTYDKIR